MKRGALLTAYVVLAALMLPVAAIVLLYVGAVCVHDLCAGRKGREGVTL